MRHRGGTTALAGRSANPHPPPNPSSNCSGTRSFSRSSGGARGPRPCSASSRVIGARVVATSAQRIGPEQRGQVSTSAWNTTLGSPRRGTWASIHAHRLRCTGASSFSPSSSSWSPRAGGGLFAVASAGGVGTTRRRREEWLDDPWKSLKRESTPKYRNKCQRGGGTAATRRGMRSAGSKTSARVPPPVGDFQGSSRQGRLKLSSSLPSARRARRSCETEGA